MNEKKRALSIIETGNLGEKPSASLGLVARYYRQIEGVKGKKLYKKLDSFMEMYYNNYNPVKWSETIEKIVKTSAKYPLLEINEVPITESELKKIEELSTARLQRVAFTMLCLAKYYDLKNDKNNHWVNVDDKSIFSLASTPMSKHCQNSVLHVLYRLGFIDFSQKIDNLNSRVLFIDTNSPVALQIKDFRQLGLEYMLYKGGNYVRCNNCGKLVKQNKNGTRKFCNDCVGYIPKETKVIICDDCGKEFIVSSKNNKTKRCPKCQEKRNSEKACKRKRKQRESR